MLVHIKTAANITAYTLSIRTHKNKGTALAETRKENPHQREHTEYQQCSHQRWHNLFLR